jgi:16S rRNA (cytosine(1402)-N(4))-methyltransferase
MKHVTVLLHEAVEALNLKEDSVVVDCTFGGGGHARAILEALGPGGTYVGIDVDGTAYTDAITSEIESHQATTHLVVDNIIYGYGEERGSRRIAAAIVKARDEAPIETSGGLADIVAEALPRPRNRTKIHPATKTFQALRIAVNDELGALEALISNAFPRLTTGGRMAIITFHSIEDRMVKQLFSTFKHDQQGNKVTKKPIVPTAAEIDANPRARSAKLRVIEKIV